MNAAPRLIDHALGLGWDAINPAARGRAATFLHDSIAVGVAGGAAPSSALPAAAVARWGRCDPGAHRLGSGIMPIAAPHAAYLNAFQIHCQEYDAVHEPAVVHPMATIVAALLAEAGRPEAVDGRALLAGIVAGVDVAVTLGLAARAPLRFFRPATAGIFGSVAGIARMRGLDRETALDAIGLALAFASGTMQSHVEGLPVLPLQIAQAARGAVEAIDLARAGMPGPRGAIDGPFGYAALFEQASDIPAALETLSGSRHVLGVSWKPFPTGRAAHGGIVATRALMDAGLTAEGLDTLVYRAPSLIARLVGRPARADMTPSYARLCLPYLAAVVLRQGRIGLGDFDEARLRDPAILATAARIQVATDDNPDPAAFTPATADATLRDGRTLHHPVTAQFGSPADPLSRAQHLAKARDCLFFGGLPDAADPLERWIDGLPGETDVAASLSAVLRPPIC